MACSCLSTQRFAALAKAMSEQPFGSGQVSELDSLKAVCRKPHNDAQRTLIDNVFIYTADLNNTVIPNGWVLVHGKQIVALGEDGAQPQAFDKKIDGQGKLMLPGLINPHWHESFVAPNPESPDDSHIEPTAYSNGGNIHALGSMFGFISTVGDKLSLEEGLAIARWSMWTQLRSGTTALGDVGSANKADAMALAAIDLGMRLRVSRWGSDVMLEAHKSTPTIIADTEVQTADWLSLIETWDNHSSGLVGAMPSVMGAFGSSDKQLEALASIVQQYKVPYATHLAPLKNERQEVERIFGLSPIARFDAMGLLTDRLLAVHTAYASEAEYQRLIETGVNICHSPAHYGMLGEATVSETGQIGRFLKDGVWVSSSTDGDISFIGGMCEAMRGAHLGHNEAQNCNTACPPTLALKTATLYGAKALGWEQQIGSIEVGKQADLILVNNDDYRYKLSGHPLRTFIVTGSSKDVDSVMVAGDLVVEAGRSTRFDETELYQDYQNAVASARKRIGGPK
ncbi:amidohydrolase family protein [Pseudoalteromonas sp. S16_S37]|uniref:amidohydrolase family protein n=1 Tax=Pseudoalteromonas sp. S16_S37 TaxID=2720228 RepID=UPI001680F704|nr:amidohydrolase family protein [Pseudoalteromonas sp. S16_S37]MBD1583973.1 amidohydrolase family protein [Pseudoalteromonas sp. S16_S37]